MGAGNQKIKLVSSNSEPAKNINEIFCSSDRELWEEIDKMIKTHPKFGFGVMQQPSESYEKRINDRKDLFSNNKISRNIDRLETINLLIGLLKVSRKLSIELDNRPLTDALNNWIDEVIKDAP